MKWTLITVRINPSYNEKIQMDTDYIPRLGECIYLGGDGQRQYKVTVSKVNYYPFTIPISDPEVVAVEK